MSDLRAPFKYDFVGSFLRPAELKEARAKYEAAEISADELKTVEDKCITELVTKVKSLGYHVITDGEFRRQAWHLDFMWGFDGISHQKTETGLPFHDEAALIDDTFLTGKIGLSSEHPFVDHFRFVKQFEDEQTVAKQTIPAPAQTFAQFSMPFALENTKKYYDSTQELADDIADAYIKVLNQLYDAGCRTVQFDDCTWGMMADAKGYAFFGVTPDKVINIQLAYKNINNKVIAGAPEGLTINTHICRGNYHSTYANEGAYDSVADVLFGEENVDAYYLEFDDERSGGFAPLAKVSGNKKVVLGLITTKSPVLEDKQVVLDRIREAAHYVPLERLCLSGQCGFASCEIGNKLTEDEQWAKLELIKEVAEEVWGDWK